MKFFITILLLLSAGQAFATTYTFSDSSSTLGCTRNSAVNYTCTSAVTLTGTDSIVVTGTLPKTITFNSNLTLNFFDESNSAKINSSGSAANLNLNVTGALTVGKKVIIMANIQAGSVNEYGGNVVFGGSINTTTGNIAIGYSSDITGSITSSSGQINLSDQVTVGGSVTSTSGAITFTHKSTITGNVSCTTCSFNLNGLSSIINGTTTVGSLSDLTSGSRYNNAITTLTGDATIGSNATVNGNITAISSTSNSAIITIGNSSTVTGNVNAYSSFANNAQIRIKSYASVTGNLGAFASGASSITDAYIYLDSSSTVNGDVTANSTGANQTVRVEKYSGATVNGSISATAATASYATVFLYSGTVTGDVISSDDIYTYANIGGCAQTYSPSATNTAITLYLGSSTNATCRGTTSCSSDLRYIDNWTFSPTPPICSLKATKIAEYNLDQSSWSGLTNETKDTAGYTGGPYDGQGIGTTNPTADRSAPALSGTTGTCGYATFSGNALQSAFTLDGLPISTTAGEKTTVSFWMYWDGNTNYSTPIGWNLYALSIGNSVFGFDTFNGDRYGISSSGLAIGWRHIVAVFNNGNVTQSQLYIDGVKQTLSQIRGSPNNSNAYVQSTLNIGRITRTDINNLGFNGGRIDEVKVYNGEMIQAQVNADYTATHACTGMPNLLAYYQFEQPTWTTAAGQVIDASGNGYHASVAKTSNANYAQTEDIPSVRFVTSSPGTCGYAVFTTSPAGQGPIVLPANMPNLTGSFTFATWYTELSSSATARRIFADDYNESAGGFVFSANDPGTGRLRFVKRSPISGPAFALDTSFAMASGQKYFIAVSVDATNQTASIYIFNASGTLVAPPTTGPMGYFGASNAGNMTIGGAQNPSGNIYLNHARMDEATIHNRALSQAEILALLQTNHACVSANVAASSFNCIATQEISVNTGRLYTQLVNTPFAINVVALKSNGTAETSFSAASDRTAILRFKDQTSNSLINFSGGETANSKNVLFTTTNSTGIVPVTGITIPQAYRNLRCEISEASVATPSASSDNFSVRPLSLTLSSNVANPSIAGNNFTLTATGGTGYNGAPKLLVSNMSAMQSNMLTNTSNTSVSDTANNTFTAGSSATTLTLRYHDVGSINFNAGAVLDDSFTSVDQPSDCVGGSSSNSAVAGEYGCNLASTALAAVGRFKPDHFTATTNTLSAACSAGGFTYMSQPNLALNSVIEAQSAQNIAAKSYNTGTLSYTVRNNTTNITGAPSRLQKSGTTWAPASTWSNGALTLSESTLSYARLTTPDGPYDNLNINYSISDSLGDSITFSGNAFTNDTKMRYGRLNIQNTYGSELLPLTVPIEAQYWNGTTYQRNQLDTCTSINPVNITMGNYKNNLAACETQLSVASSANTTTMVGGKITAKLTKPGAGNNGSVDLTVNTNTASGTTCIPTSTTATSASEPWFGANNPSARATFGLFKSPIIYMRENY